MILRPRQAQFVDRSVKALRKRRNTLGIAPTGAGKTVILSKIAGEIGGTSIILQHRDELVDQNANTFRKINPTVRTSLYTADFKSWQKQGATFAMMQTLALKKNLDTMPPADLVIVDEGHHIVNDSYVRIVAAAKERNPKVMLLGMTATPGRGDNRPMRSMFDNVCDQITLTELIRTGHLVPPVCYVIESVSREAMADLPKKADEFDMGAVEALMNKRAINEKVVQNWKEKAGDRQTVVFASTIVHAHAVCEEFRRQGVAAEVVSSEAGCDREGILRRFDRAEFQVVINVAILTEGWDCQRVSCVVLLRPCSFKSTVIQMVGRGLRIVDAERYPGVIKNDCIVLDFGYSLHAHKSLEQAIHLEGQEGPKECPSCTATIPAVCNECPICGYEWPQALIEEQQEREASDSNEPDDLHDFVLTEMQLIDRSPFRWEGFFDNAITVANGLDAWAMVIVYKGAHYALGGAAETGLKIIATSEKRMMAVAAADDFLREHGDDEVAAKTARWMHLPPTDKQLQYLGLTSLQAMGLSRYRASCMIQWQGMERPIQKRLQRLAA